MSDVTVPAERLAQWAEVLEQSATSLHIQFHFGRISYAECEQEICVLGRTASAELRALLPQPEPTCPICGHPVGRVLDPPPTGHYEDGCTHTEVGAGFCPCPLVFTQTEAVRALLAVERDTTPAVTGPRVWTAGDPEPEGVDLVWDREGDPWVRRPTNLWRMKANVESKDPELGLHGKPRGMAWVDFAADWGPLTDQPPAGAR